jgi:hypothetical protein
LPGSIEPISSPNPIDLAPFHRHPKDLRRGQWLVVEAGRAMQVLDEA